MKGKTIILALVLVLAIGGSAVLYNKLKDTVRPPDPLQTAQSSQADSQAEGTEETAQSEERVKAPDFTVQDAGGNSVKLSDMQGKPVVLNFWASWCPPCKSEMPDFNKVFEELGGDVQFMMIDAVDGNRETKEKGAAYIAEQGYSFPVYFDMEQDAVMQYGIRAFPTSVFIDRDGYIVAGVEGAIDEKVLRRGIELIAGEVETAMYHKITPEEAKRMIDSGETHILLDVRTDAEYRESRIDGAVLIPDYELSGRAASELPDKDAVILVYCRTGRRSAAAAKALADMGYANVYDCGGILDWKYETVSG